MTVTLSLDRITVFAYHGVLPEEQQTGNTFEISLEMSYDARKAVANDDLSQALDYAAVCTDVQLVATSNRFNLIETLAHVTGMTLLKKYSLIETLTVSVHKHQLPIPETTHGATASVVLDRKNI